MPYRREFIRDLSLIESDPTKFKTVICLKIDKSETNDNHSVYIPLRTGELTHLETAGGGTSLVQFRYTAGFTPDYRNKDCVAYSDTIRSAVHKATGSEDIGDEALVTVVVLTAADIGKLDEDEESDRWVRLTRALTQDGGGTSGSVIALLDKLKDAERERYLQNYQRLLFIRLAGILGNAGRKRLKPDERGYHLSVDEQYEIEVLSSLLPTPANESSTSRWHLQGSTKHFEFFSWSIEVGQGIVRHKLPFQPRRASQTQTLRLAPADAQFTDSGNVPQEVEVYSKDEPQDRLVFKASLQRSIAPHQLEVHLQVRSAYHWWYRVIVALLPVVLAVGIVFAAGVVDQDLATSVGIPLQRAMEVEKYSSAIGAGLLIFGALATYFITQNRAD